MGSLRVTSCHLFLWSPGPQSRCPCFDMGNSPGSPVLKPSTPVSSVGGRQVTLFIAENSSYVYRRWQCKAKVSQICKIKITRRPTILGLAIITTERQSSERILMWHKQFVFLCSLFSLSKLEFNKCWLSKTLRMNFHPPTPDYVTLRWTVKCSRKKRRKLSCATSWCRAEQACAAWFLSPADPAPHGGISTYWLHGLEWVTWPQAPTTTPSTYLSQ